MGVYINMEMPKSCSVCFVKDCAERAKNKYVMSSCGQKCPLVHVPPHGDLIDRDPFIEFIKTHWDSYDQWFVEQLEARPTIIPADTAEEGE